MMKRSKLVLTALALILAAGVMIAPALAYFTDHSEATGLVTIHAGSSTDIEEPDVVDWEKQLVISNKGPDAVYVRAIAFAGNGLELNYSGSNWSDGGDGYWYYGEIVEAGAKADTLLVKIENIPEDAVDGDTMNVTVLYEATPVLYDANGDPIALDPTQADWALEAEITE